MNKSLYPSRRKFIRQNTDKAAIYEMEWFVLVVTVLLSASDFMNIYTLFDWLLTENPIYSLLVGIVVAFSLNFIPYFLAKALHKYRANEMSITWSIMLGVLFLVLFAFVFHLRWTMRDVVFADENSHIFDFTSYVSQTTATEGPTSRQNAGALVLGIMPCITSVICFCLEFFSNPKKREILSIQRDIAGLDYDRMLFEAAIAELSKD